MTWTNTHNFADSKAVNWDNFAKTVTDSSPEQAKRMALRHPGISYFFFRQTHMEDMIDPELGLSPPRK